MSNWNDSIVKEFRENGGKAGRWGSGSLLLLTTTGAKSGLPRLAPMMYFAEPDGIYVIASKGGAPEHPAWYHNLVVNPEVSVEQGTDHGIETYPAIATPVDAAKRDELWAKFAARAPGFAGYQDKTDRTIPIVKVVKVEKR